MSTTKEKIEIMQWFEDGGKVECTLIDYEKQRTGRLSWGLVASPNPFWDWAAYEYRKKIEPLECWVNVLDGTVVSTVFPTEAKAKDFLLELSAGSMTSPCVAAGRWTTRKFREVIE